MRRRYDPWRDGLRSRPVLDRAWRGLVLVVGIAVVLLGVVLLPLPGPGWVVIFLGLGILAAEFAWARRVLTRARERYERLRDRARRSPRVE